MRIPSGHVRPAGLIHMHYVNALAALQRMRTPTNRLRVGYLQWQGPHINRACTCMHRYASRRNVLFRRRDCNARCVTCTHTHCQVLGGWACIFIARTHAHMYAYKHTNTHSCTRTTFTRASLLYRSRLARDRQHTHSSVVWWWLTRSTAHKHKTHSHLYAHYDTHKHVCVITYTFTQCMHNTHAQVMSWCSFTTNRVWS